MNIANNNCILTEFGLIVKLTFSRIVTFNLDGNVKQTSLNSIVPVCKDEIDMNISNQNQFKSKSSVNSPVIGRLGIMPVPTGIPIFRSNISQMRAAAPTPYITKSRHIINRLHEICNILFLGVKKNQNITLFNSV